MSAASEGELGALHGIVARYLAEKIESGECTGADLGNAIKMLKDNNITCTVDGSSELTSLQTALEGTGSFDTDTVDLEAALEQMDFNGTVAN